MNDYDGNLRADIARLEAECDSLTAENERLRAERTEEDKEAERQETGVHPDCWEESFAETRLAELEETRRKYIVMVDKLEAQVAHYGDIENMRVEANLALLAAESRLATAVGLLSWLERDVLYIASEARRKVCAFLAAAPAPPAAPARTQTEAECEARAAVMQEVAQALSDTHACDRARIHNALAILASGLEGK